MQHRIHKYVCLTFLQHVQNLLLQKDEESGLHQVAENIGALDLTYNKVHVPICGLGFGIYTKLDGALSIFFICFTLVVLNHQAGLSFYWAIDPGLLRPLLLLKCSH